MEFARVGEDVAQVSVDAEANAAVRLVGLDVDVRRALAQREENNLVEDLDERVVLGEGREFFARNIGPVKETGVLEVAEAFLEAFLRAVVNRNGILDFLGESEDGAHGHLGDLSEAPGEIGIRRIGHRDREHTVEHVEADGLGFLGHFHRDFRGGFLGDDRSERINVGDVEHVGPLAAGFVLGEVFLVDDGLQQLRAVAEPVAQALHFLREVEVRELADPLDKGAIFGIWHGEIWL